MNTILYNNNNRFCIFSGNSNLVLAEKVCSYLGVPLGKADLGSFSDGEIQVEVHENVEGKDVFVIQSTCHPVNKNLMELLLLVDALKRAAVNSITTVIPYYGYARQDRKVKPIAPISAKLVADLLTVAGVNRIITMDLHAGQIQGFFDIPVYDVRAFPIVYKHINSNFCAGNTVIVSPDAGGVNRARFLAKNLKCDLAIIDKHRSAPNKAVAMNVVGDVFGKIAIIEDDIIDTGGTITEAAKILIELGASDVHVYCTHAVLSGLALSNITKSPVTSLVITDTIPLTDGITCDKIKVLSVSNLLGEAISRSFGSK